MTPYRLLALDVDGTLLDSRHQLRPATIAAVHDCLDAGISVILATGRLLRAITDIGAALGLRGPMIVCNGAAVANLEDGRVLATNLIDDAQIAAVEEQIQPLGIHYCLFGLDAIYAPPGMDDILILREYGEPDPIIVPQLCSSYVPQMAKLLSVSYDASHDTVLRYALRGTVSVVRTLPMFLEFLNPEASKGHALSRLAQQLGIPKAQVAAIGDSYNDLSMFANAGLSIAMGQAPSDVQAHTSLVTLDNDHDGVAVAIHKYILEI